MDHLGANAIDRLISVRGENGHCIPFFDLLKSGVKLVFHSHRADHRGYRGGMHADLVVEEKRSGIRWEI